MPNSDPEIQKANQRKHYQDNKSRYLDNQKRKRDKNKQFIAEYKKNKSCACGESHPACLEFHHTDSTKKDIQISRAMYDWGLKRLIEEVEKCELLCANCHRKVHYEEMKDSGVKLLYEQNIGV